MTMEQSMILSRPRGYVLLPPPGGDAEKAIRRTHALLNERVKTCAMVNTEFIRTTMGKQGSNGSLDGEGYGWDLAGCLSLAGSQLY
jgi:hypothetical protein